MPGLLGTGWGGKTSRECLVVRGSLGCDAEQRGA